MGHFPKVSPDERWVAFTREGRIELLRTTGGEPKPLGPKPGKPSIGRLTWSADGRTILYVQEASGPGDRGRSGEIMAVSIDGGASRSTGIRGEGIEAISLHPKGTQLLYTQTHSNQELWVMRNLPLK